jgi:hypothetical protein
MAVIQNGRRMWSPSSDMRMWTPFMMSVASLASRRQRFSSPASCEWATASPFRARTPQE